MSIKQKSISRKKLHQDLPNSWEKREELRNKGQFWTPSWIAEAMVSYLIGDTNLIFDPATGEGAFYDALKKIDKSGSISYYGTDIDPDVLESKSYQNQSNCKVELKDFILNNDSKKYPSIVANPPYIRHHRISAKTKKILGELCEKILGFRIDGRAGLHVFFLIKALSILEKNGKLAFILPADTCEGVFAKPLWDWILEKYSLEAVITFTPESTPFPNVDTNAVVILLKNTKPKDDFIWVKSNLAYSDDLRKLINSNFKLKKYDSLKIVKRTILEGKRTGITREQSDIEFRYKLSDFGTVIRGIATGANEFFTLTKSQVRELGISPKYLKRIIGRTSDVNGESITTKDLERLDNLNRPTYLIDLGSEKMEDLDVPLRKYIESGVVNGLNERSLIKTRKPWYKMEKREAPDLLFTYLGRRNSRFVKNDARVLPLSAFLCVYSKSKNKKYIEKLTEVLNHRTTIENMKLVGKSYGGGAIKVEPSALKNLPINDDLAQELISLLKEESNEK